MMYQNHGSDSFLTCTLLQNKSYFPCPISVEHPVRLSIFSAFYEVSGFASFSALSLLFIGARKYFAVRGCVNNHLMNSALGGRREKDVPFAERGGKLRGEKWFFRKSMGWTKHLL